ncbi:hypothetical protein EAM_0488 [Erwinia amylovora ATCC 49946]|nr:hypothetical protein EAM01S_23_00440 [Erwinia amylovora NBRC 12687 = CFBP 1232]CBJ45162.1 hypothetical protein EAM_0488 [Erwinia amylovora ATCC 49946]
MSTRVSLLTQPANTNKLPGSRAMIKTIAVCLAVVLLCYIAFVGHYYYQTYTTFSGIGQAQQVVAENPSP